MVDADAADYGAFAIVVDGDGAFAIVVDDGAFAIAADADEDAAVDPRQS